jgi:hypothetical protein
MLNIKVNNTGMKFFSRQIFGIIFLFILCNVPYVQYFTSSYLEANDLSNRHTCEFSE